MNAPTFLARTEPSETQLAAAHLASLPVDRLAALERDWHPVPYKPDPDFITQIERAWSGTPADEVQ